VQGVDKPLFSAIQTLRQGLTVDNPFLVIIVTAWEKSNTLVASALNSGADDLLLRPFSIATLGRRIQSHIEKRKGFVITADYIGPDRRRDQSRPSNVELFHPPNSLKVKALARAGGEGELQRLNQDLRIARTALNTEKLRRDSFQLCVLWRLAQDAPLAPRAYEVDLSRVTQLASAIALRCRDTDFEPALQWCEWIEAAVESLNAGFDRNSAMRLLGEAALSLASAFMPEKTREEHVQSVDAMVTLIKAKMALAS
jgi:CheY-like chemotaxis protein